MLVNWLGPLIEFEFDFEMRPATAKRLYTPGLKIYSYISKKLLFKSYKVKEDPAVEEEKVKEKDKNMGLDKFLSKYTSEDNDSFETILER